MIKEEIQKDTFEGKNLQRLIQENQSPISSLLLHKGQKIFEVDNEFNVSEAVYEIYFVGNGLEVARKLKKDRFYVTALNLKNAYRKISKMLKK